MPDTPLAATIFALTYAIIVSERVHKTTAALVGAVIMIAARVIDQDEAFDAIDFNVIFLLAGMMMIVNVLGRTGIFQWLAIRSAKLGRGETLRRLRLPRQRHNRGADRAGHDLRRRVAPRERGALPHLGGACLQYRRRRHAH